MARTMRLALCAVLLSGGTALQLGPDAPPDMAWEDAASDKALGPAEIRMFNELRHLGRMLDNTYAGASAQKMPGWLQWFWHWLRGIPNGPEQPLEAVEGGNTPEEHHQNNVDYVYPGERPGCFMRMPTGCPNHFMKTTHWRHDVWAEENDISKEQCDSRKYYWDEYCGTGDIKVFYFDEPKSLEEKLAMVVDGYPGVDSDAPGCFMRMPTGCPNYYVKTKLWRHDVLIEEVMTSEGDCKARKGYWDDFCGTSDVKVIYVAPSSSRLANASAKKQ